jgi:hypothetical protein
LFITINKKTVLTGKRRSNVRLQALPGNGAAMNHEHYLQFLKLRQGHRIGRIWPCNDGYKMAPLTAPDGLPILDGIDDILHAKFITTQNLLDLIDVLMSSQAHS